MQLAVRESRFGSVLATAAPQLSLLEAESLVPDLIPGFLDQSATIKWGLEFVETPAQLEELAERLKAYPVFSLDTETWGPPGVRLDRDLCLIQIGLPEYSAGTIDDTKSKVVLIDVVRLREITEHDSIGKESVSNPLEPLREVFESDQHLKIIHHAQFEINQFENYAITLANFSDTEKLCRDVYPGLPSYSLAACMREILSITMSKSEQQSDWHLAKLSPKQIAYAAYDAEATFKLHQEVKALDRSSDLVPTSSIEELLSELHRNETRRHTALRTPIGRAFHESLSRALIAEECVTKLLKIEFVARCDPDAVVSYAGLFGRAAYGSAKERQLDIAMLKKLFPSVAEQAIFEDADYDTVRRALKRAYGPKHARELMREVFPREWAAPRFRFAAAPSAYRSPSTKSKLKAGWGTEVIREPHEIQRLDEVLEKYRGEVSIQLRHVSANSEDPALMILGFPAGTGKRLFSFGDAIVIDLRAFLNTEHAQALATSLAPLFESPSRLKIVEYRKSLQDFAEKLGLALRGTRDVLKIINQALPDLQPKRVEVALHYLFDKDELPGEAPRVTTQTTRSAESLMKFGVEAERLYLGYSKLKKHLDHREDDAWELKSKLVPIVTGQLRSLRNSLASVLLEHQALLQARLDSSTELDYPLSVSLLDTLRDSVEPLERSKSEVPQLFGKLAEIKLRLSKLPGGSRYFENAEESEAPLTADFTKFREAIGKLEAGFHTLAETITQNYIEDIVRHRAEAIMLARDGLARELAIVVRRASKLEEAIKSKLIETETLRAESEHGWARFYLQREKRFNSERLRELLPPDVTQSLIFERALTKDIEAGLIELKLSHPHRRQALQESLTHVIGNRSPAARVRPHYGILYVSDHHPSDEK